MAADKPEKRPIESLLADWRAAGRDTVAAHAAAQVSALALEAATAAGEAASEVERAARAALEAVEKARTAAAHARDGALAAAAAAQLILQSAQGDKVRSNHDVEVAEEAETRARDAFHAAEDRARKDDPSPG